MVQRTLSVEESLSSFLTGLKQHADIDAFVDFASEIRNAIYNAVARDSVALLPHHCSLLNRQRR